MSDTPTNINRLPPDPEGMNNDRSEWADIAIQAFGMETGQATNGESDNERSP